MKSQTLNYSLLTIHASLLFTIIFSLLTNSAKTQNLDSLWSVWNDKTQADTARLKAMHKMARDGYLYSKPDSAFYYAQMEYDLAEKNELKKQMAQALYTQGVSFFLRGDYPKALDYFQRRLEIYEEIGDKKGIARVRVNMGSVFSKEGDYPKALEYFQRSLKIKEEIGEKKGIANILNSMGVLYMNNGNNPKALDYYQKSLKMMEGMGDKQGISTSFANIANVYLKQDAYPKALDYYQRSLKIDEEIGDIEGIASTQINMGIIFKKQGDYPKALEYLKKGLKKFEEMDNKQRVSIGYINVGSLYLKQGKNSLALDYCQRSLTLAEEIGDLSGQKIACNCLYEAHKAMGNGNKTLEFMEKMRVIEDSLNSEETSKKLQQMEFQKQVLADSIETAEKERLVQEAHQEEVRQKNQTRNLALGGGLVLLIIAGGLYGRVRYIRKSKAVLQSEKDRSENLLLNLLPADIAAELKEKGKADARDFDKVSILFTDFKGFTEQSAKMSAADLVNEINTCFEAFDGIMPKYNIEKIKTIGDAYMAAGGLPVPTDDSVKNTVLAALEMQDFIVARGKEQGARGLPFFEMRVGIHTGPVVAGIVGVKKFQYDIWGDTVNTASRMESSGEVGKVNISQATYEMLKDDPEFVFENRGKIEAKGKGEMEMWFVSLKK